MNKTAAYVFQPWTWEAVCADPHLRDLPFKIELNRYNQIVMSPANAVHSRYQGEFFTACSA